MSVFEFIFYFLFFSSISAIFLFTPLWANLKVFRPKTSLWVPIFFALFVFFSFIIPRFIGFKAIDSVIFIYFGFLGFYIPLWILFGSYSLYVPFFKKILKPIYISIFVLSLVLVVISSFNFYKPIYLDEVTIFSSKVDKEYTFLHITDTQFGSLNKKDIEKISSKINGVIKKQPVDAILFTGDIVDTNKYSYEDLKSLSFENTLVYFSFGNHEFYHNTKELTEVLNKLEYYTLRNQKISFSDNIDIMGIDDARDSSQVKKELKKLEIDKQKFNLMLYHRPDAWEEIKSENIDLAVVGHSHGGQTWPYTSFTKWMFGNGEIGLNREKNQYMYHSPGAGLWGPKMRLGTTNTITLINIKPE